MKDTKVHQSLWDRFLGIGSVDVNTVDDTGDIRMTKLNDARRIGEDIRRVTEALKSRRQVRILSQ